MTVADDLAEKIVAIAALPADVTEKACDAVFDLLTAALSGLGAPSSKAAQAAARRSWGPGQSPTWFTQGRLTPPGAAFVNAALASAMDLDDGHRAAVGHPGAGIIPAVFASLPSAEVSDDQLLLAIAVGYEVAVRVAASRDHERLTTMVSGPWIGQGAAAAAGVLRGLPARQIAQAIAIAGASAPNLLAVGYSSVMGNHLKEGIPWGTATGLTAVDLAAAGFTGPVDILDNEDIHCRETLIREFGTRWALRDVYFKPYSCCRWAHAAIDCALRLQTRHGIDAASIERIDIETFGWALRLNNELRPKTLESAQYSVPFCVALALTGGKAALLPMQSDRLEDPATLHLARKIHLHRTDHYDRMFPKAVPARIAMIAEGGKWSEEVLAPLGEASNPMSRAELTEKFDLVAGRMLTDNDRLRFKAAISALRAGELSPIVNLLDHPLDLSKELR